MHQVLLKRFSLRCKKYTVKFLTTAEHLIYNKKNRHLPILFIYLEALTILFIIRLNGKSDITTTHIKNSMDKKLAL